MNENIAIDFFVGGGGSQSQSVYFKKHAITKSTRKELSYSYTCDQEIYRVATLDYR